MKVVETDDLFKIVDERTDNGDTIARIKKTGDEDYDADLALTARKMAASEELYLALKAVADAYDAYCDDESDSKTFIEFMDDFNAIATVNKALKLVDEQ